MIIFDLDGTLADCEHRRHFVDANSGKLLCGEKWKPDWDAFHKACDKDKPVYPVWDSFNHIRQWHEEYQIWSDRCESMRKKTIYWLMNRCPLRPSYWDEGSWNYILKMRPIGDYTPDHILKEKWLDEALSSGKQIDFVFDDRPKVVRMWRNRGIFVFDCNQTGKEF